MKKMTSIILNVFILSFIHSNTYAAETNNDHKSAATSNAVVQKDLQTQQEHNKAKSDIDTKKVFIPVVKKGNNGYEVTNQNK